MKAFEKDHLRYFEPEAKVGLVATVSPEGLPHITLLTSLQARSETELVFGQFSKGVSKVHVKDNPKTGFLILTPDRKLWRGKAHWTRETNEGPEYEMFNQKPMFRYNAYMGIRIVHYLDLIETGGRESMPLLGIGLSSLLSRMAAAPADDKPVLNPWSRELYNRFGSLKFLAAIDDDGYPWIVPLFQCRATGLSFLAFSTLAYGNELSRVKKGTPAAVFGMTMRMESVLARGVFTGIQRERGVKTGRIELDWVYNSMPPKQGRIYPPVELKSVSEY